MTKRSFICLAALISLSLAAYSKEDGAVQPYPFEGAPLNRVFADITAVKTASVAIIGASVARNPEFIKTFELAKRTAQPEGADKALKKHDADARSTISDGPAQPTLPVGSAGGHATAAIQKGQKTASIMTHAAITDDPHITVPMWQMNGLPVGLSRVGTAWTEPFLMSLGYAYELAWQKRVPSAAYEAAGTVS